MSANESFLPENTFLVTINLQLSCFKNKFKWSFCHFCCKTKTQQRITLCGKPLTLFLLIWWVAAFHYPYSWLLKWLSIQETVLVQHDVLSDAEIWDVGYLTQTQTLTPSMFPLILSLQYPKSLGMPHLLCLSCFFWWWHCCCCCSGRNLGCAVSQEQETFPVVRQVCPAPCDNLLHLQEEKLCPGQGVNVLEKNIFRRPFCMQS